MQRAFAADGAPWVTLRIDGGMTQNSWLAQDLADMLGLTVERPADVESTARGAAMLVAVGVGLYSTVEGAEAMLPTIECFNSSAPAAAVTTRLAAWHDALERTLRQSADWMPIPPDPS